MKVYIAGPMRGIPDNNYPAFEEATYVVRAMNNVTEVFSPVEWDKKAYGPKGVRAKDFDIRKAFATDMEYICKEADAIAMLPGWEKSSGAQAEWAAAKAMGLKFIYL